MANEFMQTMADARVDARSLSEFIFKPASFMVTRRLAPSINTLEYYLNLFNKTMNQAIINSGFITVDSFELGATLTQRNQALRHTADGKLYRWAGDLPKTVPANSTPENSGGIAANTWVEVSDVALRQLLLNVGGASKLGNGATYFKNLSEFTIAESGIKDGSSVFLASITQGLDLDGNGRLYTYSLAPSSDAISIKTPLGYLSRKFDGKVYIAECGASGYEYDIDSPALQTAFDIIRNNNGGILSMGTKCSYFMEGYIQADVSDLDWQFNGSDVTVGIFFVSWHPNALGYGNYKNIKITDAVWIGNRRPKDDRTGYVHMDMVKIDGVTVTGCTYIEATYAGHNLDLMGCRYVDFTDNEVLGSNITDRLFTESVQIGQAAIGYSGARIEPEREQFLDNLLCHYVNFERNTFKPYINPITGIKTYPPRPVGDHSAKAHTNINVSNNTFDNIISLLSETAVNSRSILSLSGAEDCRIENNTIISNDAVNVRAIRLSAVRNALAEGERERVFSISGNIIKQHAKAGSDITGIAASIEFVYYRLPSIIDVSPLSVSVNNNVIDSSVIDPPTTFSGLGILVNSSTDANNVQIRGNDINLRGGFHRHIGVFGTERKGTELIENNKIRGLVNHFSISIGPSPDTAISAIDNTFYSQWRALYVAATPKPAVIKGNVLQGFSNTSFAGVVDTEKEADGGKHTILAYGVPIVSSGNILIGETRLKPVKLGASTDVQPEWQYLITP